MLMTSKEWNPGNRTLDDYADEVITIRVGGYAFLDCGFLQKVSDPEFSHRGDKGPCAADIRRHARGEQVMPDGSNRPPHPCFQGNDLRYRLMPHWDRKERMIAAGLDPDEQFGVARNNSFEKWDTSGEFFQVVKARRHAEFLFTLLVAEQSIRVAAGDVLEGLAREEIVDAMIREFDHSREQLGTLTDKGLERLCERMEWISMDPDMSDEPTL